MPDCTIITGCMLKAPQLLVSLKLTFWENVLPMELSTLLGHTTLAAPLYS
jgi:hypothetical protein